MNSLHVHMYGDTFSVDSDQWATIMKSTSTFVFFDYICVPESKRETCLRHIPSYIRRSSFMVVLVPPCTHHNRIDPRTNCKMNMCYRTYRRGARSAYQMFSAYVTEKGHPMLLIRSGRGVPEWISTIDSVHISLGHCRYLCCETNHKRIKTCRRGVIRETLSQAIDRKVEYLFQKKSYVTYATQNHNNRE